MFFCLIEFHDVRWVCVIDKPVHVHIPSPLYIIIHILSSSHRTRYIGITQLPFFRNFYFYWVLVPLSPCLRDIHAEISETVRPVTTAWIQPRAYSVYSEGEVKHCRLPSTSRASGNNTAFSCAGIVNPPQLHFHSEHNFALCHHFH